MFHEKLNVTIISNFIKIYSTLLQKRFAFKVCYINIWEKNRKKWNLILKKHRGWVMIVFQRIVQNII